MPNLRKRIERLEGIQPPQPVYQGLVIQEKGETQEECLRRHFGEAGPPADHLIIINVIV